MVKYSNVKIFVNDAGKRMVQYTRTNSKGVQEDIIQPYFTATGEPDPEVESILVQAAKNTEIEKLEKKNSIFSLDKFRKKKENKKLPKGKVSVNKNWFKKHPYLTRTALVVAGIGLGGLLLKSCGPDKDKADNSKVIVEDDYSNIKVEGAKEYITYGNAIADMAKIGLEMQELGYDNVSQGSINALYFITNYNMFDKDTIKTMVDKGVISEDAMVIVSDSLEVLSVVQDQGGKAVTGQDKPIIDLTMFCVAEEDKELLTHAKDNLEQMKTADDEKAQEIYDSYYKYLNNEEDTEFPLIYNEASKGANYLLNQGYGGVFGIAGGHHGVKQSKLDYVERHTGMNDFSSVIKAMQGCLSTATEEMETTKTY